VPLVGWCGLVVGVQRRIGYPEVAFEYRYPIRLVGVSIGLEGRLGWVESLLQRLEIDRAGFPLSSHHFRCLNLLE